MSQYFGRAKIRANGEVLDTQPGATLDLGGVSRSPVNNDQSMGFSESVVNSQVECQVSLKRGESIDRFRSITDATITFECDTGQRYVIKDGFITEPPRLTGGQNASVRLVFAGQPAEEIVS